MNLTFVDEELTKIESWLSTVRGYSNKSVTNFETSPNLSNTSVLWAFSNERAVDLSIEGHTRPYWPETEEGTSLNKIVSVVNKTAYLRLLNVKTLREAGKNIINDRENVDKNLKIAS